jgi:anti-sigma regulatory factor (Ser/Thr protein kinase)
LAVVNPRPGSPITRPVIVMRDGQRSVVRLRGIAVEDGGWEFTVGEELPDAAAPDHADVPDARLAELSTMVWMTDADRLARWFNPAWLAYVGSALDDELGWGWMRHAHPDDLVGLLECYEAAQQHRRGFDHVLRVADAYGEFRWLLVRALPRLVDGDFVGFIGLCRVVAGKGEDEVAAVPIGQTDAPAGVIARLANLETAFEVTRPAEPIEVVVLRRLVARWVASQPGLRERHDDIVLAVGEAVANSVVHAYRVDSGLVQLSCSMHEDRAEVRVRDWGLWRARAAGHDGNGLTLMHALSDGCEIRHLGNATEVVLSYDVSPSIADAAQSSNMSK